MSAIANILTPLEEPDRRALLVQLIRRLEAADTTAEEMFHAQEQLDWFAREIKDWFRPVGYKLLVYIPYLQAMLESGLAMPDQSRSQYQTASIHAYVIAMGSEAYLDQKKFPNGPWCKEGDRILMRAYSGTRFKRSGYPFEYALINDDTVDGVMDDQLKIERPI